jgi:hypothetical protein
MYIPMKRILILLSLVGLSATICFAARNADSTIKEPASLLHYKAFQLSYVKGSIEEVPLTDQVPEIITTKLIAANEHSYVVSLRSFLPPFSFFARPPP